jgi:PIN domain nuclease of toxin-antitoxin system
VAIGSRPLLVDTHFILWTRIAPKNLTRRERNILIEASIRHISVVSLWEIAILLGGGRVPNDDRLLEVPEGFTLLPIRQDHCKLLATLPRHHRDPFDRMLIAQAQCEGLLLLTRDRAMEAYREYATILPSRRPPLAPRHRWQR